MDRNKIMNGFIIILIFSLACAAIYAVDDGEDSQIDSSNGHDDFYIIKSYYAGKLMNKAIPTHQGHDGYLQTVHA